MPIYGNLIGSLNDGNADTLDGKHASDFAMASDVDELQTKVLPSVTTTDNGKFMVVVDGVWAAETIPEAEGASF